MTMRQYEPIWIELKKRGRCELIAPTMLHDRIKKAVIKEKYNDATFKVECDLIGVRRELAITSHGTKLSFSLSTSSVAGITVGVDI